MSLSIQAMAWAIEQQEIREPSSRLVLICLCNYADPSGDSIFPGLKRLSNDTGLGERALRYQLRKLEKASILVRGSRAIPLAKGHRKDRIPTCYRVNVTRGNGFPPDSSRGAMPFFTGGNLKQNGGQSVAPDPKNLTAKDPPEVLRELREDQIRRGLAKP